MPQLCKDSLCTGCAACANACPHKAIEMQNDNRGFLHPILMKKNCIECKLCEKKCPSLRDEIRQNDFSPKVYAAWHTDKRTRLKSSSGGAFSALAEEIIKQNGIVYGAAWDGCRKIKHIAVNSIKDLDLLKQSKYIPSQIGNAFAEVKEALKSGKRVLFSGTPCQIAGLYSFLGNYDLSNLVTVDFICHGVPSPVVYNRYIDYIEKHYDKTISCVNFRDKRLGVESNLLLNFYFSDGKEKNVYFDKNSFYRGFVDGLFLRQSCYNCSFNIFPRVSDISLSDYRGLGKSKPFDHLKDRNLGFSGVIVNTGKGQKLISSCSNLNIEERPKEELFNSQPHLYNPIKKNSITDKFWDDFSNMGYKDLARKYMAMPLRMRILNFARLILRPRLYYWISRKCL